MLTVCVALFLGSQTAPTIHNGPTKSPVDDYAAIRQAAKLAKMPLFAPDGSLRGYTLKSIDIADVKQDKPVAGLTARKAVRLTYWNKATHNQFDIVESPSGPDVDARAHTKWLFNSGKFNTFRTPDDTFVSAKRDGYDMALLGTLISEPSASLVLERMVEIKPD